MVWLLLVIFQLKHFLCDYPLQGRYMLGKFEPYPGFILPLLAHSSVHGAATLFIALALGSPYAPYLALLDIVAHFAMDRVKASPSLLGRFKNFTANEYGFISRGLRPPTYEDVDFKVQRRASETCLVLRYLEDPSELVKSNAYFWWSLGLDQMVHHLSDIFIVWVLLR